MNRRGFLKGILIAPVAVGVVGATKKVKQTPDVIKVPSKPAHLMSIFSVEVDSHKRRNVYGKAAVLTESLGFDSVSVEMELDAHQPFASKYIDYEEEGLTHINDEHAFLQVKIKEPGIRGKVLMDSIVFRAPHTKYYLPLWLKKGSKISVRVKDNRKFLAGYTVRMLLIGGME